MIEEEYGMPPSSAPSAASTGVKSSPAIPAGAARISAWSGRRQVPSVMVACADDALLGSAMLVAQDMDTRPQWSPWLAGVVVAPEHRRRGIGASLGERVITEARTLGFPTLYLYTFSTEQYYARLGWRFMERAIYLGADVTIMSLKL